MQRSPVAFQSADLMSEILFSLFSFLMFLGTLQVFRIPLELLLHHWSSIGTIPVTMTWTGQNWDILSGIAAVIIFPIANRYRKAVWLFQAFGFVLLINLLRVVVMSSPLPFAWPLLNPLQLVMYFPYALIAPLFVSSTLFGHLVLFRKLLKK